MTTHTHQRLLRRTLPSLPLLLTLLLACATTASQAQPKPGPLADNYPNKTIRVLVSSAAGGGNDVVARAMSQKLGERTGQSVVVDNRAGGNGIIAMDTLAQAAPDGYTLLSTGNLLVLNGVQKKVPYDVRTAFDPLAQMTLQPYLMVVIPAMPVSTVKEFIAYAKTKPGALNYGSAGVGSVNHLGTELFSSATGISLVHVPYKGNAQAFTDLVSGRIQLVWANGLSSGPFIRSGKLKAIAVASLKRMHALPDVPTVSESGVADFEMGNSYFLYAPAGMPRPIITALNREVIQIMNASDMKERLAADGAEPGISGTPAELKSKFLKEYGLWESFLKTSGIKLD